MQGEEPSARLVYALVDEVGGERRALVYRVGVLKRIMNLRVRHAAGVEPHVDEVGFALHGLTCLAAEYYVVDIRAVKVNPVVILLRIIAGHEAIFL